MLEQIQVTPTDYPNTSTVGEVQLSAIQPEDQPALRRWFDTISPESRYARFHGYTTELSSKQWDYLTSVDGHDHVAFLAWRDGQLAGVGRWIRIASDSDLAEIAFLVGDDVQRSGIGTRLRARLVAAARDHGVRRFRAYVQPHNRAIRKLLASPDLESLCDSGGIVEVRIRDMVQ